jgi:hypothetical protein
VITNQLTASSLSLWGKTAEKRIKQSMKKDLELVYVAQVCLSWEALQHQYILVRDSSNPADSRGRFDDDISREFQNFQVLLERFLEDERCEGKRVLSFVQRRFELISFFQVPRLSGYNREGPHEGEKERQGKQVLKAIETCIEVFYDFVKVDIKKPLMWERLQNSLVNSPLMELEDPRDFRLFLDLKISLQKVISYYSQLKTLNFLLRILINILICEEGTIVEGNAREQEEDLVQEEIFQHG